MNGDALPLSYHRQVPQTGWSSAQEDAPVLKSSGSDVIKLTHQPLRSWLKASAESNISSMSVTLLVSQLPMSWLNEEASRNISPMSVTLLVSQLPMSPLKSVA